MSNWRMSVPRVSVEDVARVDAEALDPPERMGPDASRNELSEDVAALVDAPLLEAVDLLHRDGGALHPGDLAEADDAPAAVRPAVELDDDVDGARDHLARGALGQLQPGHAHHRLEPRQGVPRRVGVDGRHRPLMAGVHGLEHVE